MIQDNLFLSHRIRCIACVGVIFLLFCPYVRADVTIKIRVINPLDAEKITPVQYYLPQPLRPDDIIEQSIVYGVPRETDTETTRLLKISFDDKKGLFFIDENIRIRPKEVILLQLKVEDVWQIDQSQIAQLEYQVKNLWDHQIAEADIKDVQLKQTALILKDQIFKELKNIVEHEEQNTVSLVGINRHIEAYEQNLSLLNQVKGDIAMLENLIKLAKAASSEDKDPDSERRMKPPAKDL